MKRKQQKNSDKWYKNPMIWVTMISSIFGTLGIVSAAIITVYPEYQRLKEENLLLQNQVIEQMAEIQRLETSLSPFKVLALQRYTGTDTEVLSKLALRIQEIESMVYTLQTYSDIAKMDITGNPGIVGVNPVSVTTPISRKLSGVFKEENDQKIFTCNEDDLQKYREVIEEFPRFPFSYYMLAVCYNRADNEDWKLLAKEAVSIFEKTTLITGHNEFHDKAMQNLLQALQD